MGNIPCCDESKKSNEP